MFLKLDFERGKFSHLFDEVAGDLRQFHDIIDGDAFFQRFINLEVAFAVRCDDAGAEFFGGELFKLLDSAESGASDFE